MSAVSRVIRLMDTDPGGWAWAKDEWTHPATGIKVYKGWGNYGPVWKVAPPFESESWYDLWRLRRAIGRLQSAAVLSLIKGTRPPARLQSPSGSSVSG